MPNSQGDYYLSQEDHELLKQPRLTEVELKEFFAMYPYMSDYPYEEVHKFWYKNIKNLSSSVEKSEQSQDNIDQYLPGDPKLLDESIDSE